MIEGLLGRWLLHSAIVISFVFGTFLLKNWFDGTYTDPTRIRPDDRPMLLIAHVIVVVASAACALFLWSLPKQSITSLRSVEIILLTATILFFIEFHRAELHKCLRMFHEQPSDPLEFDAGDVTNDSCNLRWFLLIVAYGVYIPNSLRRWAIVTTVICLLPIVITFTVDATDLDRRDRLIESFIWLSVAAALAATGPIALNRLKAERTEARRFGDYRLVHRLGHGSMGIVFLAEHWLYQHRVALKVVRPELIDDSITGHKFEQKFREEMAKLADLHHPNIVHLIDAGTTEDGHLFYVMEYVSGQSLEQLVTISGKMLPGRVVYILDQLCSALAIAHEKQIIHRDIKPNNVMVSVSDSVKVLDFGIAAIRHRDDQRSKIIVQDQIASDEPSFLDDIYGLGITGCYLLAGPFPFEKTQDDDAWPPNLNEASLEEMRREIPADLLVILGKCLSKNPDVRYRNVQALKAALRQCECAPSWDEQKALEWWNVHNLQFPEPFSYRQATTV